MSRLNQLITLAAFAAGLATSMPSCALAPKPIQYEKDGSCLTNEVITEILDPTVKIDMEATLETMPPLYLDELMNQQVIIEKNGKKQIYVLSDSGVVLSGSCSGVTLKDSQNNDFYVLTANHCQPPSGEFRGVKIIESKMETSGLPLELTLAHPEDDLALLKLDGELPYFHGKIAEEMRPGDFIVGAGYPFGWFKTLLTGRYVADDETELNSYTVIDTHAFPGDSGGPLFVLIENEGVLYRPCEAYLVGNLQVVYLMDGLAGISPVENLTKIIQESPLADDYLQQKKWK